MALTALLGSTALRTVAVAVVAQMQQPEALIRLKSV
jgi:hypothetical protein